MLSYLEDNLSFYASLSVKDALIDAKIEKLTRGNLCNELSS